MIRALSTVTRAGALVEGMLPEEAEVHPADTTTRITTIITPINKIVFFMGTASGSPVFKGNSEFFILEFRKKGKNERIFWKIYRFDDRGTVATLLDISRQPPPHLAETQGLAGSRVTARP